MSGVPIRRAQVRRLHAVRPARRDRRAVPHLLHLFGRGLLRQRQHLYALLDRRGGARRRLAVRRHGQRHRRDLRRARLPHHRRPALRLRLRSAVAAAVPGRRAAARRQHRRVRACSRCATGWTCSDERDDRPSRDRAPPAAVRCRRVDPAVATAFGCIILLLLLGSLYSPNFLSPEYLLQQLKVASFLGVIATGMMLVILLGQIDLSVPWVVAVGGMMACGGDRLWRGRRSARDPLRHPLRRRARPRQRLRRRLSAHPLDDHHARHQCRRAGPDGRLYRRLLAAGFRLAGDALHRHRRSSSSAFRTP